jgi:Zn-dependent M28 family amino/carboxypeptidase
MWVNAEIAMTSYRNVFAIMTVAVLLTTVIALPGKGKNIASKTTIPELPATQKRLTETIEKLAGQIGARSLTSAPAGLAKTEIYIQKSFADMGYSCETQEYTVDSDAVKQQQQRVASTNQGFNVIGKKARNIIASLPGSDRSSAVIIVGAHYDSVFDCPAANDNGSGIACLIELARELAHKKFAKTIRFVAFTNEEPPFFRTPDMGSRRYVKLCADRKDKIVAMLSLETMGYYSDKPGSQRAPKQLQASCPTVGNFIAIVGNTKSAPLVANCAKYFRKASSFPCVEIAAPDSVPGLDFSDQQGFWQYGYPAIMVTDTAFLRYPYYHTNKDTPDRVNYEKLAQVSQGLVNAVKELADSPQ